MAKRKTTATPPKPTTTVEQALQVPERDRLQQRDPKAEAFRLWQRQAGLMRDWLARQ